MVNVEFMKTGREAERVKGEMEGDPFSLFPEFIFIP